MATEPVGLSQDLGAGRVMRAHVNGQDLAIWRGASLSVQAWGNRCPHRGMRLSHGFVRGDSLACAYHGWHYNCQATCHYIPAHPELEPPTSIKPEVFGVTEQHGVLWVDTDDVPTAVMLPEDMVGIRSITFECISDHAVAAFSKMSLDSEIGVDLTIQEFSAQPKILSFQDKDNEETALVLFQPNDEHSVVAHVLAKNSWSVEEQIKLSRWCESVRREAESKNKLPKKQLD